VLYRHRYHPDYIWPDVCRLYVGCGEIHASIRKKGQRRKQAVHHRRTDRTVRHGISLGHCRGTYQDLWLQLNSTSAPDQKSDTIAYILCYN